MSQCKQIVDMYEAGLSLAAIGAATGRPDVYRLLKKLCIPLRPLRGSGPNHSQWTGGRLPATGGYMRQWIFATDPMASMRDHQGYVREHRLILARKLGRPLTATETVHHIDGDKSNNTPENLQLRNGKHGKGTVMCCADCGSHNIMSVPFKES